jgi:predicted TPR repeat methyltransferase
VSNVEARLAEVYHAASQTELSKTYDQWAADYDADMQSLGYAHPAVISGLASRFITDLNTSIVDAGAGTGIVGHLLNILGFINLHGLDMSQGMLARAKTRGVYKSLHQATLGEPINFSSNTFGCIVSTGTFTTGHAPPSAFAELTRIVKPGGYVIFTVAETVWAEQNFAEHLKMLKPIWATEPYAPMPFSKTESGLMTRAHVYQHT